MLLQQTELQMGSFYRNWLQFDMESGLNPGLNLIYVSGYKLFFMNLHLIVMIHNTITAISMHNDSSKAKYSKSYHMTGMTCKERQVIKARNN